MCQNNDVNDSVYDVAHVYGSFRYLKEAQALFLFTYNNDTYCRVFNLTKRNNETVKNNGADRSTGKSKT